MTHYSEMTKAQKALYTVEREGIFINVYRHGEYIGATLGSYTDEGAIAQVINDNAIQREATLLGLDI